MTALKTLQKIIKGDIIKEMNIISLSPSQLKKAEEMFIKTIITAPFILKEVCEIKPKEKYKATKGFKENEKRI